MKFPVGCFRCALLLLAGLGLSGCLRSPQNRQKEEKESHFLLGRNRVSAMDYQGAIESFEKALEVNPKSASAHFELACLLEKREADPAAAIYHYQQYLKLRPNAENREFVNQHIFALKQEIAKTVSLGPVTERQQREFERLAEENRRLNEEVEKWRACAARLQVLTNEIGRASLAALAAKPTSSVQPPAGAATVPVSASVSPTPASLAGLQRTHTVKARETPTTIARKYGVKLDALMAANPRLEPRHLQVGQTLNIPAVNF